MTKPWIMDGRARKSARYVETHLALKREVEVDRKSRRARKTVRAFNAQPALDLHAEQ